VTIGDNTNIQDNAYVGAASEFSPPVVIGSGVSIGHGAVLKGCRIGDNVLVGISAVVSEGVQVRARGGGRGEGGGGGGGGGPGCEGGGGGAGP
jgi:carbonic anhydrase/acetyltransferase-like protein (isoleucine patch superfamily)